MHNSPKKFNFTKWGFIIGTPIALIGAIAAVVALPEIRCNVGLDSEACPKPQDVTLVVRAETGEALPGVKVEVVAKGAPEIQFTDNNGYATVKISNKGSARIFLSKQDYPNQDFNINLENDQNVVRTIQLSKSGKPNVSSTQSIPTPTAASVASSTPLPNASPIPTSSPTLIDTPIPTKSPLRELKSECTLVSRNSAEQYSNNISVGRQPRKPRQRVMIGQSNPYSTTCEIIENSGRLKLTYAIPDNSSYLSRVKVTLYLDGKLAQSMDVYRGEVKTIDRKDIANKKNFALNYEVVASTNSFSDYFYLLENSEN